MAVSKKQPKPTTQTEYEIDKLSDYQHARLRTEMYLSSRSLHSQTTISYLDGQPVSKEQSWVPAVFTAFREIFDNALDEVVTHGHGNIIRVTYDAKTTTFTVEDNGRGIPIEYDERHGQYAATMALSETKAGRNFGDRGASRGLNGVGASVVNFCSEKFSVHIKRNKKEFTQYFEEGTELVIHDPTIFPYTGLNTGTKVEVKLSKKVFPDMTLTDEFVKDRVYEAALCYPKLKIYYNDTKIVVKNVEKDLFPKHKPITFEIADEGFKSNFWLVPQFFEDSNEMAYGLVNAIPMFNGGVHIDAFRKNFYNGVLAALESRAKKEKLTPNKSDVADGMLIYNITQMDAPSFDSQSKTRMINESVTKIINRTMTDEEFYKGVVKKYPEWVDKIFERCAERTMKKDDAELKKRAKKRQKVEKLKDATSSDRQKCILFLGEGDSAVSGLNEARNKEYHAGLALRGKVMNVRGKRNKEIYDNKELASIIDSVGLTLGTRANRHTLRYGSIYIATDADEDGKNIAALLTNFFHYCWPELFEPGNPFINVFETPLIIAVKGKQRKYWYADNYDQFNPDDYNKSKGWDVTRAKGLAALKKDDWKYVLENPKLIPIVEDGELENILNVLFSKEKGKSDERKAVIGM